jgi:amino acid transporter
MDDMAEKTGAAARFTTFGGVFTPCTLTILGVIMFLRFGQVVGNAGIMHAIWIVLLAKLITTLTALSLSAIATNTRMKGGGAYYLISRSLGLEFGGAIGVVFFLSQAVSVAMYVIGFTEALVQLLPVLGAQMRSVATLVNLVVLLCVYVGAGWTIRVQYVILGVLLVSICAFTGGALRSWDPALFAANMAPAYLEGAGFWAMFALFFPAATGIMAGANMSGDLKDPGRSIPRGTLLAIAFTGLVYVGFAVLLGASVPRGLLHVDSTVVAKVSLWAPLIMAGVFAATLSSALGSMMGAPRILQALARDRVLPVLRPFGKGSGAAGEPRRATLLAFLIAEAGIMLGDLNAIAPVITMFFMITYGAINLATFFEAFSGNPSYRPTFRYCHWLLSLVGAICCGAVMLLISPLWAVASVLVMYLLHHYLTKQELEAAWGDVVSGTIFERVRSNLLLLEEERYHAKNWRPSLLVMGAASEERLHVAAVAKRLVGGHGLLMLGKVILGDQIEGQGRAATALRSLRKSIASRRLTAFPVVTVAPSLVQGTETLVQCSGIGAIRPNMVMFAWSRSSDGEVDLLSRVRAVAALGRSVALYRVDDEVAEGSADLPEGTLDVWWQGQGANGHLMLLLAHLLRSAPGMRGTVIRVLRMVGSAEGVAETRAHLDALSAEVRIPCRNVVVVGDSFQEVLHRESGGAAIVMLGMADPLTKGDDMLESMAGVVGDLPRVLFVYSAGDMSLHA